MGAPTHGPRSGDASTSARERTRHADPDLERSRFLKARVLAGRALLAGLATLFALVVLELSLRLFAAAPPPEASTLRTFTEYDPELGWKGRPGAKGPYITESFTIDVELNRGGWRDDEPPSASGSHAAIDEAGISGATAHIIALVGDSFAWGFGVNRGEMFADKLEGALRRWRVENYAVCGYGTDQELLVLRRHALAARPRLVLVEFAVGNDLENILTSRAYHLPKPQFVFDGAILQLRGVPVPRTENWDRPARTGMRDILTRHLRLYAWARSRWPGLPPQLARLVGRQRRDESQDFRLRILARVPSSRVARGWRMAEALLDLIRNDAEAAGARVALLVVPDRLQVEDALWDSAMKKLGLDPSVYDRDLPDRKLDEIGRRLGIEIIDPLARLRESARRGETLFLAGDPHWNARGHAIAAEELTRALEKLLADPPHDSGP